MTRKGQYQGAGWRILGRSGIFLTRFRALHARAPMFLPAHPLHRGSNWTFFSLGIITTMSSAVPPASGAEVSKVNNVDMPANEAHSLQRAKNALDRSRYQYRKLLKEQVFALLRWVSGVFGTQKCPKDVHGCTHLTEGFLQPCPRALSPP